MSKPMTKPMSKAGENSSEKNTMRVLNIVALCVFLFIIMAYHISSPLGEIDIWVNKWISGHRSTGIVQLFTMFTMLGNTLPMVVLSTVAAVVLACANRWKKMVLSIALMLVGWGGYEFLKSLFLRARPINGEIEVSGYALPSGHATMSIIFYGLLMYLFVNRIRIPWLKRAFICFNVEMILLMGFSRIYLGVHWLSDVLAGFALGLFLLSGAVLVGRRF